MVVPAFAFSMAVQAIPGPGAIAEALMAGVTRDLAINAFASWHEKPGIPAPAEAAFRGYINYGLPLDYVKDYVKYHGVNIELIKPEHFHLTQLMPGIRLDGTIPLDVNVGAVNMPTNAWVESVRYAQWTPTNDEIFEMMNRGYLTDLCANHLLKRNGLIDPALRDEYTKLRFVIPPIQDLIRFEVRESFNEAIVAQYGYAEEYPTRLNKYIAQQGLSGKTGVMAPPAKDAGGAAVGQHDASWGELYWYAHWEVPSPTQAYEMLHRLYSISPYGPSPTTDPRAPGRIGGGNVDLPAGMNAAQFPFGVPDFDLVFDRPDLTQLLKVSDYPPHWRKRLEAISYNPLTRVDTRRMYRIGVINEADVYHSYRAGGYDDKNAQNLTRYTMLTERPNIESEILNALKIGLIDEDKARQLLRQLDQPDKQIDYMIRKAQMSYVNASTREQLVEVRHGYLTGSLGADGVRRTLATIGIHPARVLEYLQIWNLKRTATRKHATALKILRWYADGIINQNEVTARLQNLNYDASDVNRMLQDEQYKNRKKAIEAYDKQLKKMNEDSKKQQEKRRKESEKQADKDAKEKKQTLQELIKDQQKSIKEIAARSTDKNLLAWYAKGLITPSEIKGRLALRGYDNEDAERWLTANDIEDETDEANPQEGIDNVSEEETQE